MYKNLKFNIPPRSEDAILRWTKRLFGRHRVFLHGVTFARVDNLHGDFIAQKESNMSSLQKFSQTNS